MCYHDGMAYLFRTIDNVIVTDMPGGRIIKFHDHRRARVRKKYCRAMVFRRKAFLVEAREELHDILRVVLPHMSAKGRRRICRALNKAGIPARLVR